jgi:hypothetical protein
VGAQQRDRRTGNSAQASPGLGQRQGGRATEGNGSGDRCSVRWGLQTQERAKEGGGAPRPFIGVGRRGAAVGAGETAGGNGLNAIEGEAA